MVQSRHRLAAFTIIELLAVVTILGVLAAIAIPRATSRVAETARNACQLNRAEIELQTQLWRRNHSGYPTASLTDIGADTAYFPEGLPECPVDGTSYTIDTTTGRVTGHAH
jgi:prepilin-type N-terminal cleavage/methylation domain-containing protein